MPFVHITDLLTVGGPSSFRDVLHFGIIGVVERVAVPKVDVERLLEVAERVVLVLVSVETQSLTHLSISHGSPSTMHEDTRSRNVKPTFSRSSGVILEATIIIACSRFASMVGCESFG